MVGRLARLASRVLTIVLQVTACPGVLSHAQQTCALTPWGGWDCGSEVTGRVARGKATGGSFRKSSYDDGFVSSLCLFAAVSCSAAMVSMSCDIYSTILFVIIAVGFISIRNLILVNIMIRVILLIVTIIMYRATVMMMEKRRMRIIIITVLSVTVIILITVICMIISIIISINSTSALFFDDSSSRMVRTLISFLLVHSMRDYEGKSYIVYLEVIE